MSTTEKEIADLFDRWNESLKTEDPNKVLVNYAPESLLLPTVSNTPCFTAEEKVNYFTHFLASKPVGEINKRQIQISGDMAVDSGIYTFTMGATGAVVPARYSFVYRQIDGEWLIISHHSSGMPEG